MSPPYRPRLAWLVAAGVAFTLGPAASAQADTLASDRPGFANSTTSVPLGRLVVEGGLGLDTRLEGAADPRLDLPKALVRVGLPAGLEARLTVPSLVLRPDAPALAEDVGATDVGLGVKMSFEDVLGAAFSAVATVTIPLEVNGFGADDDATVNLNANYVWSPVEVIGIGVAVNVGWARRALQTSGAFSLSAILGPVSPYLQMILDRSAASERVPLPGGASAELTQERYSIGFGGGLAWLLTDTFQIDASVDVFPYSEATSLGDALPSGLTSLFDSPVRLQAGMGASVMF